MESISSVSILTVPSKSILKTDQAVDSSNSKYVRFNDIIGNNNYIDIDADDNIENVDDLNKSELGHLRKNNQSYLQHCKESLSYSGKSFKASFYFLIHAFIPDVFEYKGSITVDSLNEMIKSKYDD